MNPNSLPATLAETRRREVDLYGSPIAKAVIRQVREMARR